MAFFEFTITITTHHAVQTNESRRHKIVKSRYKMTNWHDYNNGFRQRGDFSIDFSSYSINLIKFH